MDNRPLPEDQKTTLRQIIVAHCAKADHTEPQPNRTSLLGRKALSNRLVELGLSFKVENKERAWVLPKTAALHAGIEQALQSAMYVLGMSRLTLFIW